MKIQVLETLGWVCLDIFNLGLLTLKLQRLSIIRIGGNNKIRTYFYYANIVSAAGTLLAFTFNAMVSIGPLALYANNPGKDTIQASFVVIARFLVLIVDTPTAVPNRHTLLSLLNSFKGLL